MRLTRLVLPLYLKNEVIREEDGRRPYRELSVTVTVQPPCIVVRPPRILLTPVPLGSEASALITLLASGYPELVSVRLRSFALTYRRSRHKENTDTNIIYRRCAVNFIELAVEYLKRKN